MLEATMNPFDLIIDFVGMCMFVPDLSATPPKLHVVMIAPDQVSVGHPHAAHHPRMFFNAAHLVNNSTGESADYGSIALNDKLLDLSQVIGTSSLAVSLPHVPNVSVISDKKLPRSVLGLTPQRPLGGRVEFASGTVREEKCNEPWSMPFMPLPDNKIAFEVQWVIPGVNNTQLDCVLTGLNGRGSQPTVTLYPFIYASTGRAEVRLRVENVPISEVSPLALPGTEPPFNTPAAHFAGHYSILNANEDSQISPVYIGRGGTGGLGTAFSCMPAQGTLG
jgi:hypothetical protein